MNLTEEEMSAAIDEPARLTAELHRLLKEKKFYSITLDHMEAYHIEAEKVAGHSINWEEPF